MANDSSEKDRLTEILRRYAPDIGPFEEHYRDFHRNPELSRQESRTARIAADFLKSLGPYRVTEKIGGHGVVGVLANGPGPKVLLRADMDALPVPERTGLGYASQKMGIDPEGRQVSVMHACTFKPVPVVVGNESAMDRCDLVVLQRLKFHNLSRWA